MRPLASRFARVDAPLRIVSHRGGAALAPENTLAAYRAAMERGEGAVECDVHVSRDGELVVIHDPTLQRTTDGRGRVSRRAWAELNELDAGAWNDDRFRGEGLPRLGEVLDLTRDRAVTFVELKRGHDIVERVAEELERRPEQRAQIVLMSFDARLVAEASRRLPDLPRVLLRHRAEVWGPGVVAKARRSGATMLGLEAKAITRKIIRRAHDEGMPVYAFTVNGSLRARTLVAWGIDGLITDRPPEIARALGRG